MLPTPRGSEPLLTPATRKGLVSSPSLLSASTEFSERERRGRQNKNKMQWKLIKNTDFPIFSQAVEGKTIVFIVLVVAIQGFLDSWRTKYRRMGISIFTTSKVTVPRTRGGRHSGR